MSFLAQDGSVFIADETGSYELKPCEVDGLLAIYARNGAVRLWLDLDAVAQEAGYPASTHCFRMKDLVRPDPSRAARRTQEPALPQDQHFDGGRG